MSEIREGREKDRRREEMESRRKMTGERERAEPPQ